MSNLPPTTQPPVGDPVIGPQGTRPALWVAVGLISGILVGLLAGFFAFKTSAHSRPSSFRPTPAPTLLPSPTDAATPTASPSVSASSSPATKPSATSAPTAPPPSAPPTTAPDASGWAPSGVLSDSSFSGCPAMAGGQHPLADVTGPTASGATASAGNEWYGCGNAVTPGDTPGFTGSNWELAYSFSCPDADSPGAPGVDGLNVESWVYAGGGTPIQNSANKVTAALPWSDNVHSSVPQGGDYRLRTRLVNNATGDNRCRWHIRAYTTPP